MVRKRSLHIVVVTFVVGAILALNRFAFDNALQSGFYRIAAKPIAALESRWTFEELARVKNERDRLLGNFVEVEALRRENTALRRQLNVVQDSPRPHTTARLFSLQRNTLVSTVLIDKGRADGIATDMTVISAGNILVGKVSEVFEHSARVIILDDPRVVLSVLILDTDLLVESRGDLAGILRLNLISHTDTVETDMLLVTSGLDDYPPSLTVGKITSVETEQQNLFKVVRGKMLFDPATSPIVFVLP